MPATPGVNQILDLLPNRLSNCQLTLGLVTKMHKKVIFKVKRSVGTTVVCNILNGSAFGNC